MLRNATPPQTLAAAHAAAKAAFAVAKAAALRIRPELDSAAKQDAIKEAINTAATATAAVRAVMPQPPPPLTPLPAAAVVPPPAPLSPQALVSYWRCPTTPASRLPPPAT
eukprot:340573-Prymnesium_polylepis.1